jgi:hypothetical protein
LSESVVAMAPESGESAAIKAMVSVRVDINMIPPESEFPAYNYDDAGTIIFVFPSLHQ